MGHLCGIMFGQLISVDIFSLDFFPISFDLTNSLLFNHSRWRFFRYGPHCVYRPHIDGSWPASRIDDKGQYECYSHDGEGCTIKSYHTFLIYLNDNFQGGQTRFYVPKGDGTLVAYGIAPKCGSVLVFSQGNTASLLHEGAAVTHGHKFVIRTDVLYQTRPNIRNNAHSNYNKAIGE